MKVEDTEISSVTTLRSQLSVTHMWSKLRLGLKVLQVWSEAMSQAKEDRTLGISQTASLETSAFPNDYNQTQKIT